MQLQGSVRLQHGDVRMLPRVRQQRWAEQQGVARRLRVRRLSASSLPSGGGLDKQLRMGFSCQEFYTCVACTTEAGCWDEGR